MAALRCGGFSILVLAALALNAATHVSARAQDYPTKPITLVIALPPVAAMTSWRAPFRTK